MKIRTIISVKDVTTNKIVTIDLKDISSIDTTVDTTTNQLDYTIFSLFDEVSKDHYEDRFPQTSISKEDYDQLYKYVKQHNLIQGELPYADAISDAEKMVVLAGPFYNRKSLSGFLFKFSNLIRRIGQLCLE